MRLVEKENSRAKLAVNIVVMAISLYAVSQRNEVYDNTSRFENFMIDLFAPTQRGVVFVKSKISRAFEDYIANVNASLENRALSQNVSSLKERIFQYEEVALENKRLKDLLQFGTETPNQRVLARVVAWDATSDQKSLRINKGMKDGLKLESTVVTSDGLVGYVFRVSHHFADVLTIGDSNNRVDSVIQRIRSYGIVEGFSNGKCLMKYVARTEPIMLNDVVLTSGLGNIYPKGIKIGSVSRIERESYGITQHIEVTPSVDFEKLEEVIVLVPEENAEKKKELESLDESGNAGKDK